MRLLVCISLLVTLLTPSTSSPKQAAQPSKKPEKPVALYLEEPVVEKNVGGELKKDHTRQIKRAIEKSDWLRLVEERADAEILVLRLTVWKDRPPLGVQVPVPFDVPEPISDLWEGPTARIRYFFVGDIQVPAIDALDTVIVDDKGKGIYAIAQANFVKRLVEICKEHYGELRPKEHR